MTNGEGQGRRFVWEDGATACVAAVGLVLCLRARAYSVPCAFLPFALPALGQFKLDTKGNIVTNNGAITVGDKTRVEGTATAAIGAVTIAPSAKIGTTASNLKCPGSPVTVKPTLKTREWRQIFMR